MNVKSSCCLLSHAIAVFEFDEAEAAPEVARSDQAQHAQPHINSTETPKSTKKMKSIPPNPPQWEPTSDLLSITIPGFDLIVSVND